MLRISKLTDYGTVVLAELAGGRSGFVSAAEVAAATGLAVPTVSKLLKTLAKAGLVTSTRGSHGGYRLARDAAQISAADVIDALEGPVSITECSSHDSHCDIAAICNVGSAWQRINVAIRRALDEISLSDLLRANSPVPRFQFADTPISFVRKR
ncbi:MAG: SUF system Fe-S cluster assembly regulator [Woeseiaceae bacterium]